MPKRNKVHTGKRGGKYYLRGGKKVYIKKNEGKRPCMPDVHIWRLNPGSRGGIYYMSGNRRVYVKKTDYICPESDNMTVGAWQAGFMDHYPRLDGEYGKTNPPLRDAETGQFIKRKTRKSRLK